MVASVQPPLIVSEYNIAIHYLPPYVNAIMATSIWELHEVHTHTHTHTHIYIYIYNQMLTYNDLKPTIQITHTYLT